ncbi:hypothetical protein C8Q74DRAFT_1265479 [Fomes fomentarius]|nr:hypothetical protein C8Q74DRAFT_1265479 [Fomes fomentarius]
MNKEGVFMESSVLHPYGSSSAPGGQLPNYSAPSLGVSPGHTSDRLQELINEGLRLIDAMHHQYDSFAAPGGYPPNYSAAPLRDRLQEWINEWLRLINAMHQYDFSGQPNLVYLITGIQQCLQALLSRHMGMPTPSLSGSAFAMETSRTTEGSALGHIQLGNPAEGRPEDIVHNEDELFQYIDFEGSSMECQRKVIHRPPAGLCRTPQTLYPRRCLIRGRVSIERRLGFDLLVLE